jgi:glycosyltransferase involved in cell wall biosynthesis
MPLKIAYLTSGAAGMFCGSCMHDNTLARALMKLGCDVQLVPLYTPIRTDEPDVSTSRVFFGGLNVYFEQKIPGYARLPRWLTGWLDRPGLLRWATSFGLQTDGRDLGALAVSILRGQQGLQRREVDRLVDWLAAQPRPDVIHFTNLLIGGCIPTLKSRLGSPVVVTLQGDDIFLDSLPEPYRSQAVAEMRRLTAAVDRFIVNSDDYGRTMTELLALPPHKLEVLPLTIDTSDFEAASDAPTRAERARDEETRTIGYLARLAPEKGLHVLVDAFIRLRQRPATHHFRLRIAGWLGEHRRSYADEQFGKLRAAGLADAFEHVGEVDRRGKVEFLRSIDVLSVPTTYREPKGLFALESLAAGAPVVLPAHGAFPELLDRLGGGRLVPPDNPVALADVLEHLLRDDTERLALGAAGRKADLQLAGTAFLTRRTLESYAQLLVKPSP